MRQPLISILWSRQTLGWAGALDAEGLPIGFDSDNKPRELKGMPARDARKALIDKYRMDAHFLPYHVVDAAGEVEPESYRLHKTVLPKVRAAGNNVLIDLMVFDVDDEYAHKWNNANKDAKPMAARDEWQTETLDALEKMPWFAELGIYSTRGGFRLIFRLPVPLEPEHYEQAHYAFGEELGQHGVKVDHACKDWTRCYRLPFVVRDNTPQEPLLCDLDKLDVPLSWPIPAYVPGLVPGKGRRDRSGQLVDAAGKLVGAGTSGGHDHYGVLSALGEAWPLQVPAVIDANRNVMLMRVGGVYRRNGMDGDALYFALRAINEERCSPPLDEEEVRRVARSLLRYPPDADTAAALARAASGGADAPKTVKGVAGVKPRGTAKAAEVDATGADMPTLATPSNLPPTNERQRKIQPKDFVGELDDDLRRKPQPRSPMETPFRLGSEWELAGIALEDAEDGGTPLVFDRNRLWRYCPKTGIWRVFMRGVFQHIVGQYDGSWVYLGPDKKTGADRYSPLKIGSNTLAGCYTVAGVQRLRTEFFDNQRDGLSFDNGFVHVAEDGKMTMESFDPDNRATSFLPITVDLDAQPPALFLEFLDSVFRDAPDKAGLIQLVREFFGAALIGRTTRFQKAMILVGEGANGKSTLQAIVAACFDPKMITSITPQSLNSEYNRAMLATSKINMINELPEADILASESVKALISGESINAREIRQEPFTFCPRCAQLWSANSLPAVRDMTRGFWRRFLVVPFDRQFAENEQVPGLAKEIITLELPQIVAWAVHGAATLCARGRYDVPESATHALDAWQEDANPVLRFLRERYELSPSHNDDVGKDCPAATQVFAAYLSWAAQNGHKGTSLTMFGGCVKSHQVAMRKVHGTKRYGLRARRPETAAPLELH